ncbi:MAG: Orn/Lys/Arg decarboxylase N-terminal domain-containing protein [Sarcina sp.]
MINKNSWKILIYYIENESEEKERRLSLIKKSLKEKHNFDFISTSSKKDFLELFYYQQDITAIFIEYYKSEIENFEFIIQEIRKKNKNIPIISFSVGRELSLNPNEFSDLTDFYFLYADSIDFLTGRLVQHSKQYIEKISSPFLKNLIKYSNEYKYAWHTPGHMGGCAFRKNPPGKFFYDFLGENVFRTDLSISVTELGSLLDHNGPIGESEKFAAKVFGADKTFYVLNGTSSSNQIIWRFRVTKNDLTLVDRNCHKSLNHAMIATDAIPNYMIPRRNYLGIIGPVPIEEFTKNSIENHLKSNNLIKKNIDNFSLTEKKELIKIATLTNSTYDGICYNVSKIKELTKNIIPNLHFDEAWFAYAKFHPIYKNFFAMSEDLVEGDYSTIFASQSTHKLLAAFSQASMLHVKKGKNSKVDDEVLNEAYMMYCSTSPQYNLIASLDVSANMMKFNGEELINDTIIDAIELRKKIVSLYKEESRKGSWFFDIWQPSKINYLGKLLDFEEVPSEYLAKSQNSWILNRDDYWHGFKDIEEDFVMLDPIKITLKTPGISPTISANPTEISFDELGIPAVILSEYLTYFGVVAEKVDYYSILILNSIGTTKGKQAALLTGLAQFKKDFDDNLPLDEVFPELVKKYPNSYENIGLKDHCLKMHNYIKDYKLLELMNKSFQTIPKLSVKPSQCSRMLFKGNYEKAYIKDILNKTVAVMIVPYPPGIPIIMGGEKITKESKVILDYLLARETFENEFPGYISDIHGITRVIENGKILFSTIILKN